MTFWTQYQPTKIIFGAGETGRIGKHLSEVGYKRVLLIADPFMTQSGAAQKLADHSEGIIVGVFDKVAPNPTVQNVDAAIKEIQRLRVDAVIGFGGGSVLDCAKAAAAGYASQLTAEELVTGSKMTSALPLICIPTTAGTGSEVTPVAIISWEEKDIKYPLSSPLLYATMAIDDPELVYSAPKRVIATPGVDVITHCLDALTSVKHTPISDRHALNGAKIAFDYLEKAVNDQDKKALNKMMLASLIAGLAFSQTGTTGSHACSYYLTSKYHVVHGEATAFTEDEWFRVNAKARPELNQLVQTIGFKDADEVADRLNDVKKAIGLRTTLEEIHVPLTDLGTVAERTIQANNYSNNIVQLNKEEIKQLLLKKSAGSAGR
jgi:alcohol dehydrogenase